MREAVRKSEKLTHEIEAWQQKLVPRLRDIDPHDLHLILWSILRHKYGGHYHFLLKKRANGTYVR